MGTTTTTTAEPTITASTTTGATSDPATAILDGEVGTCMNPLLEDVESWACDCYDEMETRCQQLSSEPFYSQELCMRALVCDSPRVCSEWKAAACSATDPHLNLL